ncbi:MAG: AAA family ATPase [Thermoflexales bacterium]|nr:AAA family ATPase [Thermoflexales bacterium]
MALAIDGYELLATIHQGPVAEIYRARRLDDHRAVILKILKNSAQHPVRARRYKRDYKISASLDADGVLRPYGLEQHQDHLVMVLEDFGGDPLSALLVHRAFSLEERLALAAQAAALVADVHRHNIVHKDLKPAHFMANLASRQLKLCDFGIASVLQRETPSPARPDIIEGTLAYMSPEQSGRMNRSVDYRTDLYSLGVTLYELFSGRLPFESTDPMELVHCHLAKMPPPLQDLTPGLPPVLAEIVHKLLAKTAEERYQAASGLQADLEKCHAQLCQTGRIEAFTIATHDVSDILQISERLYGRDVELGELMALVDRAAAGSKEIIFCTGAPGIGKTSLIKELHKPIVERRGYFISGKYDLFKRNIPYSAISQAAQAFVDYLLAESQAELERWKKDILECVGQNGQLAVEFIPELALIIGPQPDVLPLPLAESQKRFHMVVQNLMRVSAAANHPLALFLDDLQWADHSSMQLLEVLLGDPELDHFVFLGAYRETEVDSTHPLASLLERLEVVGAPWQVIPLGALSWDHISQLLGDSLHREAEDTLDLASIVHAKTAGNPFFTREFLQTLYNEGLIGYRDGWTYDLARIQLAGITDNVVELVAARIERLAPHTWDVLKIAACIGFEFYMDTLALVSGKDEEALFDELKPAFDAGIVVKVAGEARFVHDKVSEAAHALIEAGERRALHHQIARALLSQAELHEERLFNIADQLNQAGPLLDEAEKKLALEFNLRAGKKAKASAAYEAAIDFFRNAVGVLPEHAWESEYPLTLALYTEWAEAEYMAVHYQRAEELFDVVLRHARSMLDKMRIYSVMISYYQGVARFEEGAELGIRVLREIGIPFPDLEAIDRQAELEQMARFRRNLAVRSVADLAKLPPLQDPLLAEAMGLMVHLAVIFWAAYPHAVSRILFELVNLSLEHGLCPPTPVGLVTLSSTLIDDFDEFELGYQLGRIALEIQSSFGNNYYNTIVMLSFYNHTQYWKKPLRAGHEHMMQAYHAALQTGNIQWASYCLNHYCLRRLLAGDKLELAKADYDHYTPALYRLERQDALGYFNPPKQAVYNLAGYAIDPLKLTSDFFDEDENLARYLQIQQVDAAGLVYFCRLFVSCVFGEYPRALQVVEESQGSMTAVHSQFQSYFAAFLSGLAYLQNCQPAPEASRPGLLSNALEIQSDLETWAGVCPANFSAMYLLVSAEVARIKGEEPAAVDLYRQAIDAAVEAEFPHIAALANELVAKFWLAGGNWRYARTHLAEAYNHYRAWGAVPKLRRLEADYPWLAGQAVALSRTSTGEPGLFDLNTVLKASQAISSEIGLEKLLSTMMTIIVENAGAQKGFLVLEEAERWLIEAAADVDAARVEVLQSVPLENTQALAETIVRYVGRTGKDVLLHRASEDSQFVNDPYIVARQPKSILCTAIRYQDSLAGVLYLENDLAYGAFTQERIELLKILLPQVAISLKNARLFEDHKRAEEALRYSEEWLKASLKEKNVLLAEIHHRVKNNLQVIVSLLNLQANRIQDERVVEALKESQARVKSMALIHEKLYQSPDLARVDLAGYVRTLLAQLFRAYEVDPSTIRLHVDVEKVSLNIGAAVPCGLLINELVTNCLKYAFPPGSPQLGGEGGEIRVELYSKDDSLVLSVGDNGVGFPPDLDFRNTPSLGLQLVVILTRQLDGEIELDRSGGTRFRITFPKQLAWIADA